jgi:hypothetical protein
MILWLTAMLCNHYKEPYNFILDQDIDLLFSQAIASSLFVFD